MIALKIPKPPPTNVHNLALLENRLQAGQAAIGGGRELLAALPVAIYITDAEGRITFFNEAAAVLWGRRPQLGSYPWPLEAGKDAPDTERIIERSDGSRVTVAPLPTLLCDTDGNVTGTIVTLVDLTAAKATEAALRESEEHCRMANSLNPQMPWTADPQGQVLEFSERWLQLTGQSREEAVQRGWRDLVSPDDLERVGGVLRSAQASGKPHDVRFRVRTSTGEDRWVRSRASPRRDADGAIIRWYGTTEDIHDAVLAEDEARAAGNRHRLASEAADDVAWDYDVTRDVISWSGALKRRFGHWPEASKSNLAWWLEHVHPDDRARLANRVAKTLAGTEKRLTVEYRFRRADGSYAHVLDRASLIRNEKGEVVRRVGAMIDLSDRKKSEEQLRLSEERFRLAASAAGLGIADIDTVTHEEHWSAELRAILGIPDDAPATLDTYVALLHADDRAAALEHHLRWLRGEFGSGYIGVHRIIRPSDGALRWISSERHAMRNDEGAIVRVIVTNKDVTEEKTAQDRIAWAAGHDAVTGLPNRSAFQARLDAALAHAGDRGEPLGLLLIDLDNFKTVNDSLGHQAGDRALAAFAALIAEATPAGAIVFRFGGDEFAVVLPGAGAAAAAAVGAHLVDRLLQPISVGARNIDLRASIGVGAFPDHGENGSDLVQNADLALYAAKADGRSRVRTFDPSLRASLQHQLSMLSQARAALDHGWIRPFYQPKIALATGRAAGFEALLRWRDPETGLKLPATIGCAFADTELARLIGEAMVLAVLADMKGWIARGIHVGKIAINASAAEFREPGFADRLLSRMAAFDVPPAMLELEITETAFLGDCAANVVVALEALRAVGMTIALDDFGTGFSSLSHLRNFPVDAIKIDRSFVAGLGESAEDRAIIEAILRLGEALGMTTVAEGVETRAQADYLRGHGCTLAQGFLFAPALDAADVPAAAEARHA